MARVLIDPRRLSFALLASFIIVAIAMASSARAEQLCAVDLNNSGDASDPAETASCSLMGGGEWQCPIQAVTCTVDALGATACPLGDQFACTAPAAGGAPACSPNACIDTRVNPIVDEPVIDDPGAPADGPVDAAGNCLGAIEIFGGRALRCRPPGLKTAFQNCCKDKGKILHDGMGSSISGRSM